MQSWLTHMSMQTSIHVPACPRAQAVDASWAHPLAARRDDKLEARTGMKYLPNIYMIIDDTAWRVAWYAVWYGAWCVAWYVAWYAVWYAVCLHVIVRMPIPLSRR